MKAPRPLFTVGRGDRFDRCMLHSSSVSRSRQKARSSKEEKDPALSDTGIVPVPNVKTLRNMASDGTWSHLHPPALAIQSRLVLTPHTHIKCKRGYTVCPPIPWAPRLQNSQHSHTALIVL